MKVEAVTEEISCLSRLVRRRMTQVACEEARAIGARKDKIAARGRAESVVAFDVAVHRAEDLAHGVRC